MLDEDPLARAWNLKYPSNFGSTFSNVRLFVFGVLRDELEDGSAKLGDGDGGVEELVEVALEAVGMRGELGEQMATVRTLSKLLENLSAESCIPAWIRRGRITSHSFPLLPVSIHSAAAQPAEHSLMDFGRQAVANDAARGVTRRSCAQRIARNYRNHKDSLHRQATPG